LTYQGLDPRTRRLRWALFGIIIAIAVGATAGDASTAVSGWLREEYDRLPWYVTRATALLSYLALTGSVIYGLLLSTKILDRIAHRAVSFTLHQDLAAIGVALALVHAAVLMIDRSVPYSPLEVLTPFAGPYRPLWVGIGQIALILSLVVLLSFYSRKRMGQKAWRRLHYLSFTAFAGATAHGLMAGSDTQAAWVYVGYLVMSATVVFLTTYRVVLSVTERRSRGAASPPPITARKRGAEGRGAASPGTPAIAAGQSGATD
jgi:DMSO/TMAO reductase YedYZ heme-binding membrane subunit